MPSPTRSGAAGFDVGPAVESLRINEIMYNPAGAEDAEYSTRSWILADSVTYSDGSHPEGFTSGVDPWPPEADGRGFSLHRIAPESGGDDPAAWRAAPPSPGVAKQL
jgi:hypothetical protein